MPILAKEQLLPVWFPNHGIDVSQSFSKQRPGTTPVGVNVRVFDPVANRMRGGQRPGMKKYVAAGLPDFVQDLNIIVQNVVTGGGMQQSQSGRVVTIVATSAGQVAVGNPGDQVWTTPTNNTLFNPPLNAAGTVFSAANVSRLWFADGSNWVFYDPASNSLETWVVGTYQPGDTGGNPGDPKGQLPVDSHGNTPRLICTWRGRTVLSGLFYDPTNWFMSAVGDPQNFDYSPLSTTPTQAIAGPNAPQGLIGEPVTAMLAYTDDVLVFFANNSIWMLRGDPMAGGQLDLISDAIGGAWGMPFCKDPYGQIYFVSNRMGIYTLVPGQQPQRISQPIEFIIQEVDTGANAIRLMWNDRFQSLHVFITPYTGSAPTTHLHYETRTGAWIQDEFANNDHNPLCCVELDGNTPSDRIPLIGSWDGFVRAIDPTATTDDGVPISSEVVLGPILTVNMDAVKWKSAVAMLGAASGPVKYEVLVGPTAEIALASQPVSSGIWRAGKNPDAFIQRRGHAIWIRLSATNPWQFEAVSAIIAGKGKVGRRTTTPP